MPAGIQPLAIFAGAQLIRQLRFGLLERDQQVLLQLFPLREILLEGLGPGRRDAALPLFGSGAAFLIWILALHTFCELLRFAHLLIDVALQTRNPLTSAGSRL